MKAIRKNLHLTQRELAGLLGVSNSVIALYERGQRSLPSKATEKLVALQLLFQQTGQQRSTPHYKVTSRQQAQLLKVEKMLKAHAQRAAAKALHTSQVLSRMQDRYQQQLKKMELVQQLLQQTQPATRERSFLDNMELDVLEALDHCGPARQAVATYQLAILKARQQVALQMQHTCRSTGGVKTN